MTTIICRIDDSSSARPLCLQWYLRGEPIGEPLAINLNNGDMDIASEKAVGTDCKTRNVQSPAPAPISKLAKAAVKRKRPSFEDDGCDGVVYGSTGGAGHGHGGPGL